MPQTQYLSTQLLQAIKDGLDDTTHGVFMELHTGDPHDGVDTFAMTNAVMDDANIGSYEAEKVDFGAISALDPVAMSGTADSTSTATTGTAFFGTNATANNTTDITATHFSLHMCTHTNGSAPTTQVTAGTMIFSGILGSSVTISSGDQVTLSSLAVNMNWGD